MCLSRAGTPTRGPGPLSLSAADRLAEFFQVAAHPARVLILSRLALADDSDESEGWVEYGALQPDFPSDSGLLSNHLGIMLRLRIVRRRRSSRAQYRLTARGRRLAGAIRDLREAERARGGGARSSGPADAGSISGSVDRSRREADHPRPRSDARSHSGRPSSSSSAAAARPRSSGSSGGRVDSRPASEAGASSDRAGATAGGPGPRDESGLEDAEPDPVAGKGRAASRPKSASGLASAFVFHRLGFGDEARRGIGRSRAG